MDDSTLRNRRRFLEGVSVGGGMLLAGCADRFGGGSQESVRQDGGETTGTGAAVAAVASVDQRAMREEQATVRQDVQNGEMNRTEARQRMSDIQSKYVGEAVNTLTGTVEGTDGVSVGKTYDDFGVVTVEGDAGAILGLLDSDDVQAFVSVADVEEQVAKQRANATESGQ